MCKKTHFQKKPDRFSLKKEHTTASTIILQGFVVRYVLYISVIDYDEKTH